MHLELRGWDAHGSPSPGRVSGAKARQASPRAPGSLPALGQTPSTERIKVVAAVATSGAPAEDTASPSTEKEESSEHRRGAARYICIVLLI